MAVNLILLCGYMFRSLLRGLEYVTIAVQVALNVGGRHEVRPGVNVIKRFTSVNYEFS